MALTCPNCEGSLSKVDHYCRFCGTQFELDDGPQFAKPSNAPEKSHSATLGRSLLIIYTILTAVFIFMLVNSKSIDDKMLSVFIVIEIFLVISSIWSFHKPLASFLFGLPVLIGIHLPSFVMSLISTLLLLSKSGKLNTYGLAFTLGFLIVHLILLLILIGLSFKSLRGGLDQCNTTVNESEKLKSLNCGNCFSELESGSKYCHACGDDLKRLLITKKRKKDRIESKKLLFFITLIIIALQTVAVLPLTNIEARIFFSQISILSITIAYIVVFKFGHKLKTLLSMTPTFKQALLPSLGLFISLIVLNFFFSRFVPESSINFLPNFFESVDIISFIVLVCVFPAFIEEIAFRGIILHKMADMTGNWPAIISSSLLFAIVHFNGFQMFYLFAFGLGVSWLTLKYRSILLPICIHLIHNFVGLYMGISQT